MTFPPARLCAQAQRVNRKCPGAAPGEGPVGRGDASPPSTSPRPLHGVPLWCHPPAGLVSCSRGPPGPWGMVTTAEAHRTLTGRAVGTPAGIYGALCSDTSGHLWGALLGQQLVLCVPNKWLRGFRSSGRPPTPAGLCQPRPWSLFCLQGLCQVRRAVVLPLGPSLEWGSRPDLRVSAPPHLQLQGKGKREGREG